MAHAGFYDGLKISLDDVIEQLKTENDPKEKCRLIIEIDQQKIGEMIYFHRSANLAEIGIKYNDLLMKYLNGKNNLDDFTFNKTLQKMIESYRISKDQKEVLRKMKRKNKK